MPPRLQAFVRGFGEALAAPGEHREAIAGSAFVGGLRIVTGHEMGRFQLKS